MIASDTDSPATSRWRGLYLTAALAAAGTALLIPVQMLVFIAWPPPVESNVAAWFGMFNANPLHGLLNLDLLMMFDQVFAIAIALGLYLLVRRESESLSLIGAAAWLVGATLFIASNTAFEVLALSQGYASAVGEGARATYLAAGQGALASYWDKGTGFYAGYVLTSIGGILIAVAMVRARRFARFEAWALIVANIVGLGLFVPGIGVGISLISVLILEVWYVAIARRLFGFGRAGQEATPAESFGPAAGAREYGHV